MLINPHIRETMLKLLRCEVKQHVNLDNAGITGLRGQVP